MMNTRRLAFVSLLVLFVSTMRLFPLPPNFSAVGALALFSGAYFRSFWLSAIMVTMSLFLADIVLGFHATMPFVYGAFFLIVWLGRFLKNSKHGLLSVFSVGIMGSVLFFIVSNFGYWLVTSTYPKSVAGLLAAYVAAIPFFHNTLLSTLLFSVLFFGMAESLKIYRGSNAPRLFFKHG